MINFIRNKDIDFNKWDRCIYNAYNGNIYAYSWYLNIVAENWDALINEDYTKVFPLVYAKKAGINYLYTPPFVQQLGLFSINTVSDNEVLDFINAIPSFIKYGEVNLNIHNFSTTNKQTNTNNKTLLLFINNEIENIRKTYSENNIRNIKKAEKQGIKIINNVSPESVISLFRENKGKEISVLKDKHYSILRNLIHVCIYKNSGEIWGAYTPENEICAGAFFLKNKDTAIFLFSATNSEAKESGAMSLLIDSYIKANATKIKILDFEGSNDKNLARFYKGFGSTDKYYTGICINRLPIYLKPIVYYYKLLKNR